MLIPLLIALLVAYDHRQGILGRARPPDQLQTPLQIGVALALVAIGWALARDVGRFAGPTFLRRMDPATAGTVGFLIRLLTIVITVLVALSVAGLTAADAGRRRSASPRSSSVSPPSRRSAT